MIHGRKPIKPQDNQAERLLMCGCPVWKNHSELRIYLLAGFFLMCTVE